MLRETEALDARCNKRSRISHMLSAEYTGLRFLSFYTLIKINRKISRLYLFEIWHV